MPTNPAVYSKSIAALVLALVIWANQKWGFALPADPDTISLITGLIITLGVMLAPKNKLTTTQAAQTVVDAKTNPAVQAKVTEIVAEAKATVAADKAGA
jgi:hypothetical protein